MAYAVSPALPGSKRMGRIIKSAKNTIKTPTNNTLYCQLARLICAPYQIVEKIFLKRDIF